MIAFLKYVDVEYFCTFHEKAAKTVLESAAQTKKISDKSMADEPSGFPENVKGKFLEQLPLYLLALI